MSLDDLGRRAVACKHWRFMDGMLTTCGLRVVDGGWNYVIGHRPGATRDGGGWYDGPSEGFLPDLSDPATLGCLLHLVREVTGEQSSASWYPGGKHDYPHWAWYSDSCYGKLCEGSTEAECLVKVLEYKQ